MAHGVAFGHVGPLHTQAHAQQHLGQRTHGNAADAGQMNPDTGAQIFFEIHSGMHHFR